MDNQGKTMKPVKRKLRIEIYLIAFLLVCLFFIDGFMLGRYIANKKADTLEISQKAISALLDLSVLKTNIFNETINYCNLSWNDVWKEKVGIGNILTNLENRLGKNNKNVIEQKKIYNEVQFKTLNLVNLVNEECDRRWIIILFFYTNDKSDPKGDIDLSERQGNVLTTLYERNKESIKIFSFDLNLNDPSTQLLVKQYNVSTAPYLVINGESYPKFTSRYELETIIKK